MGCEARTVLLGAGGRGGPSHDQSKILTDMWSLDLTTMNWTQIISKDGPLPPARFLHSFDMFLPPKDDNKSVASHHSNSLVLQEQTDKQLPKAQIAICPETPAAVDQGKGTGTTRQSSETGVVDLSAALMQDEHHLAGRKLLGSQATEPSTLSSDASNARSLDGGSLSDGPVLQADLDLDLGSVEDSDDDDDDSDDGDDEDDSDVNVDRAADEDAQDGSSTSASAAAPGSSDLDKHKKHHKKHHKHSSKHGEKKHHDGKKKHKKHHKGGVDPGPAQGSYSDAKLVVFGGQGEGGCYLNDAWEFDPATTAWSQISPIISDDYKCIGLQSAARAQRKPAADSGLFAGLRWLAGRPNL